MRRISRHDPSLRVPRYTSYPTAAQFTEAVGAEQQSAWISQSAGRSTSLYIHVPFCHSLCHYCACHTQVVRRTAVLEGYAALLLAEADLLRRRLPEPPSLIAMQWGGGTPTHLGPDLFRETARALQQRFPLAPGAEHATEIDPRYCDSALADALAESGITRVSLGVQDFAPEVQHAIGRMQGLEETARAAAALRAVGMNGLNLDLVYGLPRQSLESLELTLRQALTLQPDRLAVFGYAHVPWMKRHQQLIHETDLPRGEEREAMAALIDQRLLEAGYCKVGLDHYALPSDPLAQATRTGQLRRSFQGYSDLPAEAIIGLGASAVSTFTEGFVQNRAAVRDWQAEIAQGRLAGVRGVSTDSEERLRAAVIEALMCRFEADLAALARERALDPRCLSDALEDCVQLEQEGVVDRQGWHLSVPEEARAWVRLAAAAFDRHWVPQNRKHAPAV